MTPTPAGPASLAGTVRDAAGAPYGPAIVGTDFANVATKADPLGSYLLDRLPIGKAVIRVQAQGQRTPQTFEVVLAPGANSFDPRITVVHGQPATLSGVVAFASGRPSAQVVVSCQWKTALVAPDGTYTITGLESGTWDADVYWDYGDFEFPWVATLAPGANIANRTIP
jgi:hypothetical protein